MCVQVLCIVEVDHNIAARVAVPEPGFSSLENHGARQQQHLIIFARSTHFPPIRRCSFREVKAAYWRYRPILPIIDGYLQVAIDHAVGGLPHTGFAEICCGKVS